MSSPARKISTVYDCFLQRSQPNTGGFDWGNPFGSTTSSNGSRGNRQKQQSEENFYGFTEFFGCAPVPGCCQNATMFMLFCALCHGAAC